ncbi:MAG: hypothetical protein IIX82_04140, partial [Alistipes sp.]|nr:hypothetical protein [Alistipes sp.]
MNFTEIKERLQQVLQIVEESEGVAQLSDLERDLALQNLREVYSALRFGAVEPTKEEVNAEPKAGEVEVAPAVEVAPEPIVVEVVEPTPQPVVEEVVEAEPVVEPAVEPIVVEEEQPVEEEQQPVVEESKSVDSEVEALKTRKSAMYALYEESAPAPTLGDSFGEKRALADMIAA